MSISRNTDHMPPAGSIAPTPLRPDDKRWRVRICATVDEIVGIGATRYRRDRDIPRLLPAFSLWRKPGEASGEAIVSEIRRAMLKERTLGASGHRAYNLQRHMALAQALKAEEAAAKRG